MSVRFSLVIVFVVFSSIAFADIGVVTHRLSGCDWFLVESDTGYTLMEWYGGNDPDVGDELVGELTSYGFEDLYNKSDDDELRAYIDDYWMSESSALEDLSEECE